MEEEACTKIETKAKKDERTIKVDQQVIISCHLIISCWNSVWLAGCVVYKRSNIQYSMEWWSLWWSSVWSIFSKMRSSELIILCFLFCSSAFSNSGLYRYCWLLGWGQLVWGSAKANTGKGWGWFCSGDANPLGNHVNYDIDFHHRGRY